MHFAEDGRLHGGIDAVGQAGKPVVQLEPEDEAVAGVGRVHDRAETGDVLMPDLAIDPAGFNKAHLQAVGGLAEADEHAVVVR